MKIFSLWMVSWYGISGLMLGMLQAWSGVKVRKDWKRRRDLLLSGERLGERGTVDTLKINRGLFIRSSFLSLITMSLWRLEFQTETHLGKPHSWSGHKAIWREMNWSSQTPNRKKFKLVISLQTWGTRNMERTSRLFWKLAWVG